jgi:hypothetical protein
LWLWPLSLAWWCRFSWSIPLGKRPNISRSLSYLDFDEMMLDLTDLKYGIPAFDWHLLHSCEGTEYGFTQVWWRWFWMTNLTLSVWRRCVWTTNLTLSDKILDTWPSWWPYDFDWYLRARACHDLTFEWWPYDPVFRSTRRAVWLYIMIYAPKLDLLLSIRCFAFVCTRYWTWPHSHLFCILHYLDVETTRIVEMNSFSNDTGPGH